MKKIILPYDEYKEMLDTINKQNEALQKIENRKGTIIIDKRCSSLYNQSRIDELLFSIPKIIGEDEAKIFLKKEFDSLYNEVSKIRDEFISWKYHNKKNTKKQW